MAGTQTTLSLQDRLTGPLTKMMKAMDRTIGIMERMNTATNNVDTRGLQRARADIQSATADLERLRSSNAPDDLSNGLNRVSGSADRAGLSVKSFIAGFVGVAAAYLSLQGLANGFKKFVTASDTYSSTSARLSLVNDELQTQEKLQEKVYNAAQRSLTKYSDMASSVAKLNLLAGDAFGSNDEAIHFSELMGKAFTISSAGTSERTAGMHQLTQALASGRLQGDEYRSITENAPLLAQAIADAMGVSKGAMKELSSDGAITADIIKSALFGAADEIEEKFSRMPLTWGDAMTKLGNWAGQVFEPLFIRFSEFVNSDAFGVLASQAMGFVNIFTAGLSFLFSVIEFLYTALSAVAEFWPVIAAGLAVLLVVYLPAIIAFIDLMMVKLVLLLVPIFQAVGAFMLMHWPIFLVIGIIVALIAILMHFGVTTEQILGFVGGLFFALGAVIWNVVANAWNILAMFGEFLVNLFIDPVYAVQKLFYDMAKFVIDNMASMGSSFDSVANALGNAFVAGANIAIGGINMLIKALNTIPGVDIGEVGKVSAGTSTIISDGLKAMSNNLEAPTSSKNVVSIPRMELKNIPAAYSKGYSKGSTMKMPSFGPKDDGSKSIGATMGDFSMEPAGAKDKKSKNPTGGKLDKVGKIEDDINIADEDLKMLKELADIRSIQNFRTLQPSFTFGDMTIREDADITKIIKGIETYMRDEMDRSGEGAYA